MTIHVSVEDGQGTANKARITPEGGLVTQPLSFNSTAFQSLTAANTGYSMIDPVSGKFIVISGAIITAEKTVGSSDGAVVDIYASAEADTTTIDNSILRVTLERLANVVVVPLNAKVEEAKWVTVKTDDPTCNVTLLYYYI